MFEDYLIDSNYFFKKANEEKEKEDKIRYYRASIFLSASALEAFINYIGETFKGNENLPRLERDFLQDLLTEIEPSKATMITREKYQTLENKIKFLVAKFTVNLDFGSAPEWSHFKDSKNFRDKLVHPRENVSAFTLIDYQKHAQKGLNSSVFLINLLLHGIFSKNLRKQILELAS